MNAVTAGRTSFFTSPNNSHWKMVLKATAPAFSANQVQRMKQVVETHVHQWIKQQQQQQQESIDIYSEMIHLTFRIICEAALEYPHITHAEIRIFGRALDLGMLEFDRKQGANPLRQFCSPFLPERQAAFAACNDLYQLGVQLLSHYRQLVAEGRQSSQATVIRLIEENEYLTARGDRQKVAELIVFLVGGHDTTGFSVAAALYHLAKYPDW